MSWRRVPGLLWRCAATTHSAEFLWPLSRPCGRLIQNSQPGSASEPLSQTCSDPWRHVPHNQRTFAAHSPAAAAAAAVATSPSPAAPPPEALSSPAATGSAEIPQQRDLHQHQPHQRHIPGVPELDALFRSRPGPLGVGPNPAVVIPPAPGLSGALLRALGFYGKESQLIRGVRAIYGQVEKRAEDESFLAAFGLEKRFRTTHAMLVLHMWLCLVRLRSEVETDQQKKDAADVGQTMYELFNHDCEKRVVAAGVTVLISKWMKELEKNFYGAALAYDSALRPESLKDALEIALWRNVLSEDDSEMTSPVSAATARALARYVRLQLSSLALTGSDAFMSGNFEFSPVPHSSAS